MKNALLIVAFVVAMALGAWVELPLGPVPFIMSDFFVLLAGLLLGPVRGPLAVGLYLLAGAVGLPVFAGGEGGFEHLIGPTGGYLIGFLAAAFVTGFISHHGRFYLLRDLIATFSGQLTFFALGVVWLKLATGMSWATALDSGFLHFIFPLLLKLLTAASLAYFLRRLLFPK